MHENDRIKKIEDKIVSDPAYLTNPAIQEDVRHLLQLVQQQMEKINLLTKKTDVLSAQVLELTQEIENVKGDFGGFR